MKRTHLTISAQRTRTELEFGLVMKSTVCGGDSHFSKIWKRSIFSSLEERGAKV